MILKSCFTARRGHRQLDANLNKRQGEVDVEDVWSGELVIVKRKTPLPLRLKSRHSVRHVQD